MYKCWYNLWIVSFSIGKTVSPVNLLNFFFSGYESYTHHSLGTSASHRCGLKKNMCVCIIRSTIIFKTADIEPFKCLREICIIKSHRILEHSPGFMIKWDFHIDEILHIQDLFILNFDAFYVAAMRIFFSYCSLFMFFKVLLHS